MTVLKPLDDAEMDERQRRLMDAMLAHGRDYAVFRTMLHHPAAMEAFLGWGSYILSDQNTLSVALRELAILRTGALRRCEYEFLRHAVIARKHGFTDQMLRAIALGDSTPLDDAMGLVMQAVDELIEGGRIAPDTFERVRSAFGDRTAIDLVWTVGQYSQVCMFLLTAGVEPDPDIADDPLRELFA
ncbi:carboxymuconolactone decarboxylase family protein [Qipengyuania pelagi]|uniref:Carboxymuconolactone decarboxylase-like domain-containing protein n=1 Tax=Qipengyuania pelagi TaxID=994320 RepID=A0A844Y7D6_9SPHN|nr:carboxymuconolactone decarboxylase family protein [Qipengyuania pelagi]MXO54144.1 hypothetical protein [Qipengyuania pelagi]